MGISDRAYRQAVKLEFVGELQKKLKETRKDCDVDDLWDAKEETGRVVLELVYEYFGEEWVNEDDDDNDDDEE